MELFELVMLLLLAILASSVLDQMLPRVSLPLVQIAVGVVAAFFVPGRSGFVMDSELFLVLLIAPLLFDESRNADKRAMWTNKGAIVSLAIGLVLVTVLAVGFVLHWIEPSIPLAAAFALGAALGPTDAVAVSSLSKEVKLSKRQETLLSGEALINDASGVVSFQFAIAAATTGAFSLVDASTSFVASFFGGIAMGLVLGGVAVLAMRFIRMRGYESVTTHVVFEVFTPFFVFMAAESIHVSGILAVVAAGLLTTFAPKPISSMTTKLELASSSVWDVLVFVANGVVFVLLGMELPQAILPGWNDFEMNNSLVIGASLTIVALLVVVRFLWIFVLDAMAQHRQSKKAGHGSGRRTHGGRTIARSALVTTLAGPKGAVTLSIAFTIPATIASGEEFPFRNTLICIASVTILLTLLMANFVTPAVAPARDVTSEKAARKASARILQRVAGEMGARITAANAQAMQVVLRSYESRLEQLRGPVVSDQHVKRLSKEVLDRQMTYTVNAVNEGSIDRDTGRRCVDQLARMTRILERQQGRRRKRFDSAISLRLFVRGAIDRVKNVSQPDQEHREALAFMIRLEKCALEFLKPIAKGNDKGLARETSKAARVLVNEHKATLASLTTRFDALSDAKKEEQDDSAQQMTSHAKRTLEMASDLYAQALQLELEQIQQEREAGAITKAAAQKMREEVYLLQMGLNETRS